PDPRRGWPAESRCGEGAGTGISGRALAGSLIAGQSLVIRGRPRASLGAEEGRQVQRGQHIALRVRPRSTWRRATRNMGVATEVMSMSLRGWTAIPQTGIS